MVSTAPPGPTSTGPRAPRPGPSRSTGPGPGTSPPAPARSAPRSSSSPPTTSSTARRARPTSSPTSPRRCRPTGGPSWPARRPPRPPTSATSSSARAASSGSAAATSSTRCCGSPKSTNEVLVIRDQVTSPTYTWHLAYGFTRLIDGHRVRHPPHGPAGQCSWYEFAREIFEQAKVDTKVLSGTTEMLGRPPPRPAFSVDAEPAGARDPAALVARWPRRLPRPARPRRTSTRERNQMKLLVTGAAGFIGSTYVRIAGDRARHRRPRQADLRAAGRRTCPRGRS